MDALLPPDMAKKAEEVGVRKAGMDGVKMFVLAVLAGAFIALGAVFATTVAAGSAGSLPYGVQRLLVGTVFSLGLVLVIVGGAELFTGNSLIVMAWASGRVSLAALLRNWAIVFAGNFVGSVGTALLVFLAGHHEFGAGSVGLAALKIAESKLHFGFLQAICLGILCNVLVCLAVWLTFSARTTTDRILAVVPPIACFVAAGFEHSIANMYFVPVAWLIQIGATDSFWSTIGSSSENFAGITWSAFLIKNLLPVTIGNVIGGGVFVGAVYWFIFLRLDAEPTQP
jgi:formate transporter